jgi:hypothetical protein
MSQNVTNTIRHKLLELKLLIIDEISLVGARTLELLDKRLSQIFNSKLPFGNVSIIVLGDLYQLSPIMDNYVFEINTHNAFNHISGPYLWRMFSFFELTQVMRQNEIEYITALYNLARGALTKKNYKLFSSRVVTSSKNTNAIHIFKTNMEVDDYNNSFLSKLKSDNIVSMSNDVFSNNVDEYSKQMILNDMEFNNCEGLLRTLRLKISAKYMVTRNLCVQDGIVNGAVGVLRYVSLDKNNNPVIAWLEFDELETGKMTRDENRSCYLQNCNINTNWTPIKASSFNVEIKSFKSFYTMRTQIPIIPAEGQTICKAQGSTYEYVCSHISKSMNIREYYVSWSRTPLLSNLEIIGNLSFESLTKIDKDLEKVSY